jgi:hypothetical protein
MFALRHPQRGSSIWSFCAADGCIITCDKIEVEEHA